MVKTLIVKAGNMQDQTDNFSKEMQTIRKSKWKG